jgi:prevent-host-death family protein
MPKIVSALTARTQLGQLIRRASTDQDRFVVGKRGEPVVVIMGIKDFLKNIAPEPEVLAAIRSEAERQGKDRLSMREIDWEIAAYRQEQKR